MQPGRMIRHDYLIGNLVQRGSLDSSPNHRPRLPVAHAQDLFQKEFRLDSSLDAHRFVEAEMIFKSFLPPDFLTPLLSDSPQEGRGGGKHARLEWAEPGRLP